jgi:hypothetical protein
VTAADVRDRTAALLADGGTPSASSVLQLLHELAVSIAGAAEPEATAETAETGEPTEAGAGELPPFLPGGEP